LRGWVSDVKEEKKKARTHQKGENSSRPERWMDWWANKASLWGGQKKQKDDKSRVIKEKRQGRK